MRTGKDKIWQLALVIVGALILSFCNTGLNRTANNDNGTSNGGGGTGIALANGFKPSDITGVMICEDYSDGTFTKCYKSTTGSGTSSITLSSLFSQGWRPVGPLQNMAAYGNGGYGDPDYINGLRKSPILFYK
jgi:hypothetical protein